MKPLIFITSFIVLATFGFFILVFNFQLRPPAATSGEASFVIEKGTGFQQIAENLQAANLIRSAASFKLYLLLKGWADKLKPGSYIIPSGLNARAIAKIFYDGPFKEVSITIPEGWTLSMIENKLKEANVLSADENLSSLKIKDFQDKNSENYFEIFNGAPKEATLEGFLFPDTYRFNQNSNALEVIKKFLNNFQNKFSAELKTQMAKVHFSYFETVTMASLIEAEIPHEADRPIAAGILWKRLDNFMPLQVDATIIYIKCEIKHWADCRKINKTDFKINSPYNTYLKAGLPPGPINNPGFSALRAAIFPEKSGFWYYLSDGGSGQTIFSRTLEEHNFNKSKYLR